MGAAFARRLAQAGARRLTQAGARRLAQAGARVMLTDISPRGEAVAESFGAGGCFMLHDVAKASDWQALAAATEARFGPVSILVNNAAIAWFVPLMESQEADIRRIVDINLLGAFFGMQAVIPSMRRGGGGSIVNIASVASVVGAEGLTAYSACKWGLRGLTKSAALELGADNIRANAVHPGMIATAMTDGMADPVHQPIKRKGRPEEVAETVLFLASDASSYTTGQDFAVAGGLAVP